MATEYGPCESWPVGRLPCLDECTDPATKESAAAAATEVLWALSGRQFGLCTVTFRPCREDCSEFPWPTDRWTQWWPGQSWVSPALIGGQWFNIICGRCTNGCSCGHVEEIRLPGPVHSISEIVIDGSVVATGSYRLDDHERLVRTDGGEWPRCNDLSQNAGEPGTWTVKARFGREVPELGRWAMAELVCEFYKGLEGGDCMIPRHVTEMVREGVTLSMPLAADMLKEGRLGLWWSDMFLEAWNPFGIRQQATV